MPVISMFYGRKLSQISPKNNYNLLVTFDDGVTKVCDLTSYLELPVFIPLKKGDEFKGVVNRGSFVEWPAYEVDLSADTLWHIGVVV